MAADSTPLLLILMGVVLVGVGLLAALFALQLKELRRRESQHESQVSALRADLDARMGIVDALKRRQLEAERQLDQLRARQDQLELRGPEGHPYAQAIALAKRGAPPQELVSTFGLSPGEAELLLRMHRQQRAG